MVNCSTFITVYFMGSEVAGNKCRNSKLCMSGFRKALDSLENKNDGLTEQTDKYARGVVCTLLYSSSAAATAKVAIIL